MRTKDDGLSEAERRQILARSVTKDDLAADADKQSAGRWLAMTRRLNGEVIWTGNRVHPSRRAALIEALAQLTADKAA
jgi:hypothetical protein